MKDKPAIGSRQFVQRFPNDNICAKINAEIKDATDIISVIHERLDNGTLVVTVYYRW